MKQELDRIDAEEIAALLKSPTYGLIAARIDAEAGRQNTELVEIDHPEAKMHYIRGMIAGLRKSLEMPHILAKEAIATERKSVGQRKH